MARAQGARLWELRAATRLARLSRSRSSGATGAAGLFAPLLEAFAEGRDAADVPLSNGFGPHTLVGFKVWTDEIPETLPVSAA